MAKHGKCSQFFKVVVPDSIKNGTLELPRKFVKEHGKGLSNKYAHLKLPTGSKSKMELKRQEGRLWLGKGWRDFVEKHSITCCKFLVFKYEGRCRFHVLILDLSDSEIKFPISFAGTSNKQAGEPEVIKVKQEDSHGDDDEISNDCSLKVRKGREMERATQSKRRRFGATSATERVKAFESRNPHFTLIMKRYSTFSKFYLRIPAAFGRAYFRIKENMSATLEGENGQTWTVKYGIGSFPRHHVNLCSGWAKFREENHLKAGDECRFELLCRTTMTFKVTISRK